MQLDLFAFLINIHVNMNENVLKCLFTFPLASGNNKKHVNFKSFLNIFAIHIITWINNDIYLISLIEYCQLMIRLGNSNANKLLEYKIPDDDRITPDSDKYVQCDCIDQVY